MEIKSNCKKIVTKVSIDIELEGFEIETFKNILHLADSRITEKSYSYGYRPQYQPEREMLRKIQGELQ